MNLRERRQLLEDDLAGSRWRSAVSPSTHGLERTLVPTLQAEARGRFLDAGCGHQPYRKLVQGRVDEYISFDIEARVPDVDVIADINDLSVMADDSFDSILCSEVLEHVPTPDQALRELARVLAPGGSLILSVPFLARLHEEPHDYFRYTRYGLTSLCERAGLTVESITPTGSVLSFLGHQVSTGLLSSTWGTPVLGKLAFALNAVLVTYPANAIDRALGIGRMFPLGYVAVVRAA